VGIPNDFIFELARKEPDSFESYELLVGPALPKRLLRELVWEIGLSYWIEAANTVKRRVPPVFPLNRNEYSRRLARLGRASDEIGALVALLGLGDRFESGGSAVRGYRLFGIEQPVSEAMKVPYVRIPEQVESLIGHVLRRLQRRAGHDGPGARTDVRHPGADAGPNRLDEPIPVELASRRKVLPPPTKITSAVSIAPRRSGRSWTDSSDRSIRANRSRAFRA